MRQKGKGENELVPEGSWHCLTWKCRRREGAENQSIFTSNNGFRFVRCVQLFKSYQTMALDIHDDNILLKLKTHLVPMKPICWVAQGDVKFGLGVHQNLQTVVKM